MTRDDAKAVIELVCEKYDMPVPGFRINRVGGYARWTTNNMSVPQWALREYGEPYAIYYICHELAHLRRKRRLEEAMHDMRFKQIEADMMALWGVTAGAYTGDYPEKTAVEYGPRAF